MPLMNIFIGYNSALEYWKLHDRDSRQAESQAVPSPKSIPYVGALSEIAKHRICGRPIHLVVSEKRNRRNNSNFTTHIESKHIKRSYLDLGREIYLARPELCLLQMAQSLSVPEIAEIGCELCGDYSIDPLSKESDLLKLHPRTTAESILLFGERISGLKGYSNYRKAAKFIANRSASPRETQLMLLLCLPSHSGGYGLPMPKFNEPIGNEKFRCDLFWPDAKLALEYDSDMFHSGAEKINRDSARRSSLEALGVHVVSVASRQVNNPAELDKLAHIVGSKLGKRLRISMQDAERKRMLLRSNLLEKGYGTM